MLRAWARCSNSRRGRRAADPERSQGPAHGPRGAGEEPHGGEEQAKNLTLAILKRPQCRATQADRASDRPRSRRRSEGLSRLIPTSHDVSTSSSRSRAYRPSPPSRSSSTCPNSARSVRARQPLLPASLPSHDNPVTGPAAPSSAADGPMSARPSTCRRSSPCVRSRTSRQNTTSSKRIGKASKVAITAIMRKLVVLANALLRDDRTWTQSIP